MVNDKELIALAKGELVNSYAPYSSFRVAAALLAKNGAVYTGVNIENASYPAGICAERVAISKAISSGERDFAAIAIVCQKGEYCYPCGICRQVMSEFCGDNFRIILEKDSEIKSFKLGELLPYSFSKDEL